MFFQYVHKFKLPVNCTCVDAFVALAVDSLTVNMLAFFPTLVMKLKGKCLMMLPYLIPQRAVAKTMDSSHPQ